MRDPESLIRDRTALGSEKEENARITGAPKSIESGSKPNTTPTTAAAIHNMRVRLNTSRHAVYGKHRQ